MPLENQQQQQRRATAESSSATPAKPVEPLTLTEEELSSVITEASRRQNVEARVTRNVTTLDDALETARELGIDESHVRAAAEEVRTRNHVRVQRDSLVRRRKMQFIRHMVTMAGVVTMLLILSGFKVALIVFAAMLVNLLMRGYKWYEVAQSSSPEGFESTPGPGTCRVCGAKAWQRKATFCGAHRPR